MHHGRESVEHWPLALRLGLAPAHDGRDPGPDDQDDERPDQNLPRIARQQPLQVPPLGVRTALTCHLTMTVHLRHWRPREDLRPASAHAKRDHRAARSCRGPGGLPVGRSRRRVRCSDLARRFARSPQRALGELLAASPSLNRASVLLLTTTTSRAARSPVPSERQAQFGESARMREERNLARWTPRRERCCVGTRNPARPRGRLQSLRPASSCGLRVRSARRRAARARTHMRR